MLRHFIPLVLLSVLGAPAIAAQHTLRGQLTDSLTHGPLSGARVQLLSQREPWAAGRQTESDSLGRFSFVGVAPGPYTVGFHHPRLDSLGMDAVLRQVTVNDDGADAAIVLALPSARTLATALCGARQDTTGVIIGRIRDAQADTGRAGARVSASWGELVLDTKTLRNASAEVRSISAADGRYVLCGVPTDVPVLLQVRGGGADSVTSSGPIEVALAPDTPLRHRDVWLADSAARHTRIAGRVLRPDGAALAGARVRIRGDAQTAVADSTGAFVLLGAPAGTQSLDAIAIGFTPARVPIDVRLGGDTRVMVTMRAPVTTLDAVTVHAVMSRDTRDYLARAQKKGLGFFISGDDVRSRGQSLVSFALLRAPGLRATDTEFGRPVIKGPFRCTPRFFLDGWEILPEELDRFAAVSALGGIEVYRQPGDVPPSLLRGLIIPRDAREPCHMVFVWSKSVVDPG